MKLVINLIRMVFNKFVRRKSNGYCLKVFCSRMGMAYIKLCQILAMQNIGNVFTETDRRDIMAICYDVNPIPYKAIEKLLKKEYGELLDKWFTGIDPKPVGSASVSQVHRCKLHSGQDVVLKVKRQDILETVKKDVNTLRFLTHHFGWLIGVTNSATGCAWDYYIQWLYEELDFGHEVSNLHRFDAFVQSVSDKVPNCARLKVPVVYDDYCTPNVIVMEYIPHPTLNKINVNAVVNRALSDYIRQSFYAMFHDMPVVFHGDMHPGNLYIDDNGNLGFLDLGLIFEISGKDLLLTRKLFLCAFFGKADQLYNILTPWMETDTKKREDFKVQLQQYCETIHTKPLASYFIDVMLLCLDININPPYFLFCMAKAFVCLYGADTVYVNEMTGQDLLKEQVLEYILEQGKNTCDDMCVNATKAFISLIFRDKVGFCKNLCSCIDTVKSVTEWLDK